VSDIKLVIRGATEKDKVRWDKTVSESTFGTVWHFWDVLEILASAKKGYVERFICEKDGLIIGILPFIISSRE
jgi:hypothetical protein